MEKDSAAHKPTRRPINQQKLEFPEGDIFRDYKPDESPAKFDYLKGKYIFRFPFTITSIKWGLSLGFFFGLHTYFKKKSLVNSFYWFIFGSMFTGLPIWAFFMVKYSFYSLSLRKFEKEQIEEMEVSNLLKEYLKKKVEAKEDLPNEDLVRLVEIKQKEYYLKASQFDELLGEDQLKEFDEVFSKESEEKQNK